MRCDVLAIGTELLLGQIVDTNSSWIGEHLSAAGIDTCEHRKVGDNLGRMVDCLRELLERADAVIVCGGLGPTPDDVTREAIAEVMGVELERRDELIDDIRRIFGDRNREMPENNLRQADVPKGGHAIPNPIGTAPGLQCEMEIGGVTKVVYAVPGVPYEMKLMISDVVLPDLLDRSGQRSVIVSRSLKTWGASESGLAEMIAERVDQQTNPTIAFLARGIEGIYVRMTAKAATTEEATALLDSEDAELRSVIGHLVFAVDDDTMESEVLRLCAERGWSLGVAESLTGGFIGGRIANVEGASATFRGSIAAYASDVKRDLLDVSSELVVSEDAARQMAEAAQRVLGADVGISATGVAGPAEQDDQPVGTVFYGIAIPGIDTEVVSMRLPGDRERIRQFSTISVLNLLRMRLVALP
ncbi:MAG: competence/damage-inducible protein A [Acidimicrobiia bacterium]|jgi:competence/damage-inducible protein CinA-like protein